MHSTVYTLISIYNQQKKKSLCDKTKLRVSDNLYVSLFSGMSLNEYLTTRTIICENNHQNPCNTCEPLLDVAKQITVKGYMQLSHAFKRAYPAQTYKTDIALARMLQMPLVCVKPHQYNVWFLCERVEGMDYAKFLSLTDAVKDNVAKALPSISRSELNGIMTLAQSDRERQLIRYSIFKASGMSYTAARKNYGFQNMETTEKTCSKCYGGS